MPNNEALYETRLKRFNDAVALKEPDRLPVAPWVDGLPYALYPEIGATHKSALYDYEKAMAAHIRFHEEFQPDANCTNSMFLNGPAADYLKPTMMDWPGRAGTPLPDSSIYQMFEIEYMKESEYDELLADYTKFIFNKYLPRSFAGLEGLSGFRIDPSVAIMNLPLAPLAAPEVQAALENLIRYGKDQAKANEAFGAFVGRMIGLGFPPVFTSYAEAPFDVLSDYFRGTLGTLYDQAERPEKIRAACGLFAGIQKERLASLKDAPLPVKRVFIPMHKGMDGFISDEQYRDLYWEPFHGILKLLVDIGYTPIIYTEGAYSTRVRFIREKLLEFPPGSCMIHFEKGDFAELKKLFSGVACIFGGVPMQMLEFGTRAEVVERVKYLVDSCAAGGGYILDASGAIENAKRENIEAMFETARSA
ncbi:MAG: hypothetical protein LBS91_08255 [Clostridiales Family XIII bacterium]|jgi:hypothetical protein|nr:hypothetical protein [Clostridiales Family XIII bacterium]